MKAQILAATIALAAAVAPAAAPQGARAAEAPRLLVIVTDPEPQTQAMALVLATQSANQGARVHVLLCGPGGDLAIEGAPQTELKPRGGTPQGLLKGLIEGGATVEVCALYLPNAGKSEADLIAGVGSAKPPAIAEEMLRPDTKLFTF